MGNPLKNIAQESENLNLDRVFRQAPDTVTDEEIDRVIMTFRQARVLFINKDGKSNENGSQGISDTDRSEDNV